MTEVQQPRAPRSRHQTWLLQGLVVALLLGAAGASGQLLVGETVDEITRHARSVKVDLVVVGQRHRASWAAHWWRGSISGSLIEHSPCSVPVVITS